METIRFYQHKGLLPELETEVRGKRARYGTYTSARRKNSTSTVQATPVKGRMLTQHTGLPPRDNGSGKLSGKVLRKPR